MMVVVRHFYKLKPNSVYKLQHQTVTLIHSIYDKEPQIKTIRIGIKLFFKSSSCQI